MVKTTRTTCLITSFNYKNYVGEAIESALSQTHPFDEIIVVDDASPDGSGDLLQDCYGQNPKVKIIIHEQNQGEIAATTTGFLQSTGDIIFFLDSDDIYHPQYLETALSIYKENPVCDFIFCQLGRFQSTKDAYQPPSQPQISQYKDYIKDRGYSLILTAEEHIFVGGPTSGNSIRRKYLDKILPCNYVGDYRIYADNCVVLGSSILGARKFCLDIPLVGYRKLPLLRCKNIERRLVVSAFKNPFSWTFDMTFYGSISLESRKLVSHLNRGRAKPLALLILFRF